MKATRDEKNTYLNGGDEITTKHSKVYGKNFMLVMADSQNHRGSTIYVWDIEKDEYYPVRNIKTTGYDIEGRWSEYEKLLNLMEI